MPMNPLRRLRELGQSVWLDALDRRLLVSGELDRMIAEDGVSGMTSNPSIFQKAITGSADYDDTIAGAPPAELEARIFERIEVQDVARACDHLRCIHDETRGADGYVSIEASPELAGDTERTVDEVHRLWCAVARPNVMVKIPGTREGVAAIERCLADGVNVNVTLLFSVRRYMEVAQAFLRALETRAARGQPIDSIASVASFFVSRIDTKVDRALDALPDGAAREAARALRGRIAIANAKLAYQAYERMLADDRWQALAARGARPQRLLWGSISTKDPAYPDVYYVEALVARDTVDTMPLETLRAYRDHGSPQVRIHDGAERAREQLGALGQLGIDMDVVTRELEQEGVRLFVESHRRALQAIGDKRRAKGASAATTWP
jgi:transaldolase